MRKALLRFAASGLCAIGAIAGCSESPSGPGDDVNPALIAAASESGFAANTSASLPQGSATFTGPNGIEMDVTAEEFVQQLTWENGVVWKTSGFSIKAVPDEAVAGSVFDQVTFGAGHPGSLNSVPPGTYAFRSPLPPISFTEPSITAQAHVRLRGNRTYDVMSAGQITITSVQYFRDTYNCTLRENQVFIFESCKYQIGVLNGSVEFTGTLSDGTAIVQPRTSFSIPIQRRTIILRER